MLVFLDETFRRHARTGRRFGALSGVAIPEDVFQSFQSLVFHCRRPYHNMGILDPNDELHGTSLLNKTTRKMREKRGYSYHWNLVEDVLNLAQSQQVRVFGVVCFRSPLHTFVCGDQSQLDVTYRYLFERIDRYVKREYPGRVAKLIFDNRDHRTHVKNARAITNFFVRSQIGLGYDSILRVPFFAVSQGHNYGLQVADLVTTVIGLRFQGELWVQPPVASCPKDAIRRTCREPRPIQPQDSATSSRNPRLRPHVGRKNRDSAAL
ncbi:MAG: DUF3800 domain-containing protein [Planctomycetota bacterium]